METLKVLNQKLETITKQKERVLKDFKTKGNRTVGICCSGCKKPLLSEEKHQYLDLKYEEGVIGDAVSNHQCEK